jgi:hypothetical protein
METAIAILKKELKWIKANRDKFTPSSGYYDGYKYGTMAAIALLEQAKKLDKPI